MSNTCVPLAGHQGDSWEVLGHRPGKGTQPQGWSAVCRAVRQRNAVGLGTPSPQVSYGGQRGGQETQSEEHLSEGWAAQGHLYKTSKTEEEGPKR